MALSTDPLPLFCIKTAISQWRRVLSPDAIHRSPSRRCETRLQVALEERVPTYPCRLRVGMH
jgi:hypothetical protein